MAFILRIGKYVPVESGKEKKHNAR
jgi:hypothetical protein